MNNRLNYLVLGIGTALIGGCAKPQPVEYEPNMVLAHAMELAIEYPMSQALSEAQVALGELFGTPDEPKLPAFLDGDLKGLLNEDHLRKASGPVGEPERGLYRKHCASCHGDTGHGRGVNAAISNPYPRDFRMGKFKFKSTARGAKPLKSDLHETISNGIAGTTMVRIAELSTGDIDALVDYVIYLSWRGEVERELLRVAGDIEFESEEPGVLKNLYAVGTDLFEEEQVPQLHEIVNSIGQAWLDADQQVKQVPEAGEVPVDASLDELIAAATGSLDSPLKASIARGKELFNSETAACSKCHGSLGHGDGQNQDYDDWTKDWTIRFDLDPKSEKDLVPLLARGALPPRTILPRDFRDGVYRGGGTAEKLYHRIAFGIDGTPMPSIEGVVAEQDIWHLVNFVRSLALPAQEAGSQAKVP